MEIILENYLIIVLVGLFLVFALIGYLIDSARKNNDNKEEQNEIPMKIQEVEIKNIETTQPEKTEDKDDLLQNYDIEN